MIGMSLIGHRHFTEVAGGIDTLLVAGAAGLKKGVGDVVLLDWLRRQSREVRRIGSICWGAFLLAEAGLLDGRRFQRFGLPDVFPDVYGDQNGMMRKYGISAEAIAEQVRRMLGSPAFRAVA